MKSEIYISLLIFLTSCSLPAIHTDPRVGKKEIAAIITTQMPPQIRGARVEHMCDKPRETPEITDCKSTSGEFPASKITCHCTGCGLMLKLACYPDGNWYPTETNVCSPKNPATKCGLCKSESKPPNTRCVEDPLNGFLGEERHCLCKFDCLEITIKCGTNGLWFNSNNEVCEDSPVPVKYLHEDMQTVTFFRGNYTFSCPNGYKLDGPNSATCKNGKLDTGRFPECIIDVESTSTTQQMLKQTTRLTTTTSRPQQMMKTKQDRDFNLIYIIVGATVFIILIILILIIACACVYRKKQAAKEEILKNNPIFRLEQLTNVKDFMIVNDMYNKNLQSVNINK